MLDMSLRDGAETIVNQCLNVNPDEKVVLVNDGNDEDLIQILKEVIKQRASLEYQEYPEPETSGTEPPEEVAEALKDSDVFIAPTLKSLSHTQARINANEAGARGVTLPGINKEIWNTALQADYNKVKEITEEAMEAAEGVTKVRIKTEKGTDLTLKVNPDFFHPDTGIVHEDGEMSNLPAGEIYTGPLDAEGTLVIEKNSFGTEEDIGDKLIIEDAEVKEIKDAPEDSNIVKKTDEVEGGRNIAEFGFGTNPEAEFIHKVLQDEKILGTVHIALGDNCFCFPDGHERQTESEIHWDFVLQNPTVWFDDTKVLDEGEPIFLED
jgi:leucyl aminopeptidase (aminopeptidase T)